MSIFGRALSIVVIAVAVSGCIRSDDVRFTGVENVEIRGLSGIDAGVNVENRSGRKIRVTEARFILARNGNRIGTFTLKNEVVIPRRYAGRVEVRVGVSLDNPLAALSVVRALEQGATGFTVSGRAVLRSGMITMRYEVADEPLGRFVARLGGMVGSPAIGF